MQNEGTAEEIMKRSEHNVLIIIKIINFAYSTLSSTIVLKRFIKFIPVWGRRYLTLDKLMSGRFVPIFLWTLGLSTLVFFVLTWSIRYITGANWNYGHAFILLTNPSTGQAGHASISEWIAIVLMNLFGLFVLNGIILTLFINWVSNRKDRHDKGEARYEYIFKKKYSVIVGGHKIVSSLARDLISNGKNEYILVQTQRDAETVRKELYAEIKDERLANNVIIYSGDRSSWHELEELKLDSAQEVYVIGEPFYIDGSSHDAINLQCWNLITEHLREVKEKRIPIHVMFEYQSTFSAFQFTDLKLEQSKTFRFIPFSIYETWAQQVLIGKNKSGDLNYIPLDGWGGLPVSSHQRVHLIIVGMSKMGMALAIEAAHVAHYPNFNNKHTGRPRTLITFIDRNAKREMLFFMGRFRELFQLVRWRYIKAPDDVVRPNEASWDMYDTIQEISERSNKNYPWNDPLVDVDFRSPYCGKYLGEDFIDIDFEFIEGDVALPSIQKYIEDASADNSFKTSKLNSEESTTFPDNTSKTTIAVCLPVASEAMSTALYFAPSVYKNAQQILVQQPESGALVNAVRYGLTGEDSSKFKILKPFGMIERCDYLSHINSILPKLVAFAYECLPNSSLSKEYRKIGSMQDFIRIVEDNWLKMTAEGGKSTIAKRWSNLYCANSFDSKVRATGIDLDSDDDIRDESIIKSLAMVEHNRWIMEQLLLGIRPVDRSYAGKLPINDKSIRSKLKSQNIHPDLISNEMLGITQMYDEEIAKIIPLAISIAKKLE